MKDIIKRGSEQVFPSTSRVIVCFKYISAEVEEVLSSHPLVLECALVSCPDDTLGEISVCFAVQKPGVIANYGTEDNAIRDIKEFCASKLAPWKVPLLQ